MRVEKEFENQAEDEMQRRDRRKRESAVEADLEGYRELAGEREIQRAGERCRHWPGESVRQREVGGETEG